MAKFDYSEFKTRGTHYLEATDPSKIEEPTPGYRYSPAARVEIWRPRFTSNVHSEGFPQEKTGILSKAESQSGSLHNKNYQERFSKTGQQLKLFEYHRPSITGLYADPSMRTAVPTLLAHALNQYPDATADSSLSEHSSRIVQKGIAAGVVSGGEGNPEGSATFVGRDRNVEEISRVGEDNIPEGHVRLSETAVSEARKKVREILRPRNLSTQFGTSGPALGPEEPHPKLTGFEDV